MRKFVALSVVGLAFAASPALACEWSKTQSVQLPQTTKTETAQSTRPVTPERPTGEKIGG